MIRLVTVLGYILSSGAFSPANAGTTTADFLKWERKAQVSFVQNAMNMTGVIASQAKPKIARCLDEWYFADRTRRHDEILALMSDFKKYNPYAVILGIINDVCGEF